MEDYKHTPPAGPPQAKKWFLFAGITLVIIIAASILFYAMVLVKPASKNTSSDNTPVSGNGTSSAPANAEVDGNKSCGITKATPEGQYYVSGAQALMEGNLNYANLPGDPIKIGGYVYGGEGNNTVLPGAKIEIWQADSDGKYHPEGNGPADRYSSSQIALRGYVLADGKGYYEFKTIYPGEYEGNARRIFLRASADGRTAVTTQLLMAKDGDKTAANQDSIGKTLPSCNILTFTGGIGSFNFHLQ